jgi:hypothetical protein
LPSFRKCIAVSDLYNPDGDEDLVTIAADFEHYWLNGYSEYFGKDTPLDRPNSVKDAGMAHVHVLVLEETPAFEARWQRLNSPDKPPVARPSCDSMLIYAVGDKGTAILLAAYLEEGHERIKNTLELMALSSHAIAKFKEFGEEPLLYADLMALLQKPTPLESE